MTTRPNCDGDGSGSSDSEGSESPAAVPAAAENEYEKQRMARIAENRARLAALGLPGLASALRTANRAAPARIEKGKDKKGEVDDEEEYKPSSDEDDADDDEVEETKKCRPASSLKRKGKELSVEEKNYRKDPLFDADFLDDDEALQLAMAISLTEAKKNSTELNSHTLELNKCKSSSRKKTNDTVHESLRTRKNKSMNKSRFYLTEDEVIAFFFMFDETAKGFITMWDLERMTTINDFTWTESEIRKMIKCFDSDKDGKLSLEEFRTIVSRCGLLKET